MENIKIKYFDKEIEKVSKGDWIDLRAAEDVVLKNGEFALIPLGVGMKLPDGYEAHVVPRSSTYKNFRVIQANSFGVIDNTYCGDNDQWHFPAICINPNAIENGELVSHIHKGDRICQFRIMKNQPEIEFEEVDHLNDVSRGGIGSTGRK